MGKRRVRAPILLTLIKVKMGHLNSIRNESVNTRTKNNNTYQEKVGDKRWFRELMRRFIFHNGEPIN